MRIYPSKIVFSLALTGCLHVAALAQVCSISIGVQDFATKQGVKNAIVQIKRATDGEIVSASELDGKYRRMNLFPGLYAITAGKEGYKSSIKRVVVDCSSSNTSEPFETSFYLLAGSQQDKVHIVDKDLAPVLTKKVSMNDLALDLPQPKFPSEGRGKSSKVSVEISIDDQGRVISAKSVSGDPVFWKAAQDAAMKSSFIPSFLNGKPINVGASVTYNFGS